MNWREKLNKKVVDVINGIKIYAGGYYVCKDMNYDQDTITTFNDVDDETLYVIRITKIGGGSVWFNNKIGVRHSYTWSAYRDHFRRYANPEEILRLKKHLGEA